MLRMTFKDHFSGHATGYSAFRPIYDPEVVAWLATLAPRDGTVWDAGCGSGQLAMVLGEHFTQVVATDASAEQVHNAAPHAHVTYRVEPAESPSFPDHCVALITVAQAAHWFDLGRFYAAVRRVAIPGSPIVLLGYELMSIGGEVDRIIWWFYKGVVGAYWPPERG